MNEGKEKGKDKGKDKNKEKDKEKFKFFKDASFKITVNDKRKLFNLTRCDNNNYMDITIAKLDTIISKYINFNMLSYQKHNLLWFLNMENKIDANQLSIYSMRNNFNYDANDDISNFTYDSHKNNIHCIYKFLQNLKYEISKEVNNHLIIKWNN